MSNARSPLACVIIAVAVTGLYGWQSTASPPKQEIVHYDYALPPDTLEGMTAKASLVVRARMLPAPSTRGINSHPQAKERSPIVVTDARFQILEVLKSDGAAKVPKILTVSILAGRMKVGEKEIVTDAGQHVPPPEAEVIMFLELWSAAGAYVLAYGSSSLFVVTDDMEVTIPPSAQHMKTFTGMTSIGKGYLVGLVKQAAKGRK